jgi:plasmid stabilization system protein ParE
MSEYKAFLSPFAEYRLEKVLDYILEEFGQNSRNKFLKEFTKHVRKIEKNPEIAPQSRLLKGIHKNVITKQSSFYYHISGKEIHIITLSDNRQNPKKILRELKVIADKFKNG